MSDAGEVAGHAAQLCVGALAFAGGAAGGMSTVTVSLAALGALRGSRDLPEGTLDRAAALLTDGGRRLKLDPAALANGARGGAAEFDDRLAAHLMRAIPSEPDDAAPGAAIRLALAAATAAGRARPDMDRQLTQALPIEAARDHGIRIAMVERLGERVEEGVRSVREQLAALQAAIAPTRIFENVLDFVRREPGRDFRLEISAMRDGKVCLFHDMDFATDFRQIRFFPEDDRIVFVAERGTMRDLGFPLKERTASAVVEADRILLIELRPDGAAEHGSYVPLRIHA